ITSLPCGNCGWQPQPRRGRDVDFQDGELGLVVDGKVRTDPMTQEQQLQFYRELRGFAAQRGYKDGWAFHKCKEKGFDPPYAWKANYQPLPPTAAVAAWARSRIIAYAKARERGAA